MKKIISFLVFLTILVSCEQIMNDDTINRESNKNSKNSKIQSMSADEIIADSILTQVIGYVTENYDTVQVVNYVDIHRTNGKKYVIINCLTPSVPSAYSIGVQFFDSLGVGLSDDKTKRISCVKVTGCVCGDCDWSKGEYPTRTCKCTDSDSCPGDCAVEISNSNFSLLGYEVAGQVIRNNAVIADMNIYDY